MGIKKNNGQKWSKEEWNYVALGRIKNQQNQTNPKKPSRKKIPTTTPHPLPSKKKLNTNGCVQNVAFVMLEHQPDVSAWQENGEQEVLEFTMVLVSLQ